MDVFENATQFFHNCESAKGWEFCKEYVDDNAIFTSQNQALSEVNDVKTYVDWIYNLSTITMPGCTYKVHASAFDENKNTAIFFGTFSGTHLGEGGPVPPTNKSTNTDYVYALKMNEAGKVEKMTKIWNAPYALRELGWM
ncbi:hypothetical protein [Urechidicola vernalis]|uniref:Polyketide cyclase n=1 Tax=Urechidicola vernalis TaxID=3075600 RepID=A0ABU2Y5D7_9FLAO|nr:hypothetical protein [Urechidicola sp. P050]MDT0553417.1 hypothetical protein [Urechidicola sp. P050]